MTECILVPRPGSDLYAAVDNPRNENAVIFEYDGIRLVGIHPVTPDTLHRYKPKPPPAYYQREDVMRKYPLTKSIAPGHLAAGLNPFIQLIWISVREVGEATAHDIYRALVREHRVLPETGDSWGAVKELIDEMHSDGLLIARRGGKYRTGLVPQGGMYLIPYKPGYNPIEYQIVEFIQNHGATAREEIQEYLFRHLEWLDKPWLLDEWIKLVLKKGSIREIRKDWFEFVRPLEPFGKA